MFFVEFSNNRNKDVERHRSACSWLYKCRESFFLRAHSFIFQICCVVLVGDVLLGFRRHSLKIKRELIVFQNSCLSRAGTVFYLLRLLFAGKRPHKLVHLNYPRLAIFGSKRGRKGSELKVLLDLDTVKDKFGSCDTMVISVVNNICISRLVEQRRSFTSCNCNFVH